MQTQPPTETQPQPESEQTRKLSLVSEDQNSPNNSQPAVVASGLANPPTELTEAERKQLAKAMKAMEKRGMQPAPGFTWNPLRRLEPNRECPCLSGLKFKKCCRDKLAPIVPENVAKEFELQMSKPDLVFLTPENHDKIQARIAPHVRDELAKQQKIADEKAAFEKQKIDEALARKR